MITRFYNLGNAYVFNPHQFLLMLLKPTYTFVVVFAYLSPLKRAYILALFFKVTKKH